MTLGQEQSWIVSFFPELALVFYNLPGQAPCSDSLKKQVQALGTRLVGKFTWTVKTRLKRIS